MVRLRLICSGATESTRAGAFPRDEPLLPAEREAAAGLAATLGSRDHAFVSPTLRARQTAEALALTAAITPSLADLDSGRWAGRTADDVAAAEPADWQAWLTDPDAAPHGGESIASLIERVGGFFDGLPEGNSVGVTHSAPMRAAIVHALGGPPLSFWQIDIAPLAEARLHREGGRWRLRAIVQPRDRR